MPRPHKHPKSRNLWFRISVPADLRGEIGKTEIRKSLETTDPAEGKILQASLTAEWKKCFQTLRQQKHLAALDRAPAIVEAFLQQLASSLHGDLDAAIFGIQKLIVLRLFQAWGPYEFRSLEADLAVGYMPTPDE